MNNNPNNGGYEASNEAIDFESTPAKSNGGGQVFAIISLITGILPFVGMNLFGVCNIAAIVFAIIAKKQGSKSPMATIGLILGIISLAFVAIGLVLFIIYLVAVFGISFLATLGSM